MYLYMFFATQNLKFDCREIDALQGHGNEGLPWIASGKRQAPLQPSTPTSLTNT